ncbi:hypothetical protein SORDD16_00766 [Streptococcus oralis]|uniref:Uncharacterized protein n=1 Tax=Streptococcus oralis TaxID=1303 RepID=A0A139PDU7_STROR|nr:hypothetical protein SORDD16_00766 [Streptococcus oralis]
MQADELDLMFVELLDYFQQFKHGAGEPIKLVDGESDLHSFFRKRLSQF